MWDRVVDERGGGEEGRSIGKDGPNEIWAFALAISKT